jgi:hypothetical protein
MLSVNDLCKQGATYVHPGGKSSAVNFSMRKERRGRESNGYRYSPPSHNTDDDRKTKSKLPYAEVGSVTQRDQVTVLKRRCWEERHRPAYCLKLLEGTIEESGTKCK